VRHLVSFQSFARNIVDRRDLGKVGSALKVHRPLRWFPESQQTGGPGSGRTRSELERVL